MNPNVKLSEKVAVLATLDPAAIAAGTVVTAYVPMANIMQLSALIQTGVMGAGGTVDAKLVQATSAAGAGSKDIAGKAIAQVVKASGDGKQAFIEMHGAELDVNGGFAFVALSITVGTAASQLSAALIGSVPRFAPASALNAASVAQIV